MIKQMAAGAALVSSVFAGLLLTVEPQGSQINAKPHQSSTPTKETPKVSPVPERKTQPRVATAVEFATLALQQRQGYHGRPNVYTKRYADQAYATDYATKYGFKPSAYMSAAWCAMFVSYLADKANVQGPRDALAAGMAKEFKQAGSFKLSPAYGGLAFFDYTGSKSLTEISHVGVVVGWSDSKVKVVEGNVKNNQVRTTWRKRTHVAGYGLYKFSK